MGRDGTRWGAMGREPLRAQQHGKFDK